MRRAIDRRKCARLLPEAVSSELTARLRAGHVVSIVDLSPEGALVETGRRLLPGSRVELHVEHGDSREFVRASVVRCCVSSVRPQVVVYRGGLQFETPLGLALAALEAGPPHSDNVPTCSRSDDERALSTKVMVPA